jgi:hypothetical protein
MADKHPKSPGQEVTMGTSGTSLRRRLTFAFVAVVVLGACVVLLTTQVLPWLYSPKVVGPARRVEKHAVNSQQDGPLRRVVAAAPSPTGQTAPIAAIKLVDGEQFVRELAERGDFTEHEQTRVRSFLAFIARAQRQVDTVIDATRRDDLERRLQAQALHGIQIRVAAEKRDAVAELLPQGVPLLAFNDAAQP